MVCRHFSTHYNTFYFAAHLSFNHETSSMNYEPRKTRTFGKYAE